MEITKQRDRIACWFESQPGGCKKPHCPFQHQNILDHPREEDIKKKPDLILPVKTEEEKEVEKPSVTDVSVESERQVLLPQALLDPALVARQPQFSDPIIVQLQDGESDSESVSGSPQKRIDPCPRLSAQMEWELRRLRQIQEHEANLIGYTFEEDHNDQSEGKVSKVEEKAEDPEEYVVEEVVEIEEDNDTVHRRLFHKAAGHRSHLAVSTLPEPADDDLRHSILKHRVSPKQGEVRARNKASIPAPARLGGGAPISARMGGVAGRTLAETLGTTGSLRRIHVKKLNSRGNCADNVNVKSIAHRIGESKSVVSRLGGRLGHQDPLRGSTPEEEPSLTEKALMGRVGVKRGQLLDSSEDSNTSKSVKKRISRNTPEKTVTVELDFTIKSLADIRAEKRKKGPTKKVQKSEIKNGTNSLPYEVKEVTSPKNEGQVRVLTLAEIRASKRQAVTTTEDSGARQKRPPSPITFNNSSKKFKSESKERNFPASTNPTSNSSLKQVLPEQKITFSTRKISINRSPVKTSECVSQPSHQDIPPTRAVSQLLQQDVPPTRVVSQPSQQDVPPTRTVSQPSQQDVPPTKVVSQPPHQDVSPTKAVGQPSHHDLSPSKAVTQPSHQEIPATRAVSQPCHQDVPPDRAVSQPSHQEVLPTRAISQPSHQDAPPTRTVQTKGSVTKTFHSHSETVQEKSLGNSEKVNIDVPNSAVSILVLSNKLMPTANAKLNSSCNREPLSRIDSLLDEEEALLLEGDMLELEDDDVDEDDLLL